MPRNTILSASNHARAHPEELSAVLIPRDGIDWSTLAEYPWLEEELPWGRSRAQAALTAGDGAIPFLFVTNGTHQARLSLKRYQPFRPGPSDLDNPRRERIRSAACREDRFGLATEVR
jgi:hypothetical protein